MMNREQNVKVSDTTEDAQNNKAGYIKIYLQTTNYKLKYGRSKRLLC